ncbi:MAG: 30S ribosomal protein S4 [Puniceicoccaceae bacterium]|nr:MAG: 30S ribosomal protein S4 [Puniceicoccaceae bacterium]
MARYTGPTTRISRRFGQPIFGTNKSLEKRNFPPGIHGPRSRRKFSEYAVGLNEKQKLRYMYGLMERQFRRTFEAAKKQRGITGERFLQLLETRLDSVVYLLGWAKSRQAARQFVNHGHIRVNGRKVDISSYTVRPGDEVEVRNATSSRQLATRNIEETRLRNTPAWMTRQDESFRGIINRLPTREDIEPGVNEQLIVEFYSRF